MHNLLCIYFECVDSVNSYLLLQFMYPLSTSCCFRAIQKMATLKGYLRLSGRNESGECNGCCSRRYKSSCVTTRGALIVLVWSAVLHMAGYHITWFVMTNSRTFNEFTIYSITAYYALSLLSYPLAGFIGEVLWQKLRVLIVGTIFVIVGCGLLVGGSLVPMIKWVNYSTGNLPFGWWWFIIFVPLILAIPGTGAFEANVIQFGTDQLNFASSEVLSSYVYWYYWTVYLLFIPMMVSSALYTAQILEYLPILPIMVFIVVIVLIVLVTYVIRRSHVFVIDPGNRVNPIKLIWKVMKFIKKYRHPVMRSAFTYGEIPSRFDIAKQRYGGPFTTEEVEDVKSFWRILAILACLSGFLLRDSTAPTVVLHAQIYIDLAPANSTTGNYSLLWNIEQYYSSMTFTVLTIVLCVPFYKLVIQPFFHRCIPNMLNKLLLGLMVEFMSMLVLMVYNAMMHSAVDSVLPPNVSNNTAQFLCHEILWGTRYNVFNPLAHPGDYLQPLEPITFGMLAIPQVLNGLSDMLVFLTALEFILAQAPRTMQGLLIGLWYAMQSVPALLSLVEISSCAVSYWEYYLSKLVLLVALIFTFAVASRKYKYRQRNEERDINVNVQIHQYYDREFDRRDAYFSKM